MSRNISKRIELNDLEAKTLKMKADQCHLSESDYLRELIMNSQPVEAPPRQFYEQMEKVNRIASTIPRICATAQDKEEIAELKRLYVQLIGHILSGGDEMDASEANQSDDGWQSADEPAQSGLKEDTLGNGDNSQATESIDSYVSSRIFEPPRKEEDY